MAAGGWRRRVPRWTALRGLSVVAILLTLALEYLIVLFFMGFGLVEEHPIVIHMAVTISISPLFHLIPLAVCVVLISSWIHLTDQLATLPYRRGVSRKPPSRRRRGKAQRVGLFGLFDRAQRGLEAVFRGLGQLPHRLPGASWIVQRLSPVRFAVQSLLILFTLFPASMLLVYGLAHPTLLYDAVVNFYRGNPSFHSFVLGAISSIQSLPIIGWMIHAVNGVLLPIAPGFRASLEGLGMAVSPLTRLDLTSKYLLCQNLAAWISALTSLLCGRYAARARRRYR